MTDSTFKIFAQLVAQTHQDLPQLAGAASKAGALEVLQGMLDAGIVKPSGDEIRDVEFFAAVLPILDTAADRAAAKKLVDNVRSALDAYDPDVLATGLSRLRDPDLVRALINQGVHPNAWLHNHDRTDGHSVIATMLNFSKIQSFQSALTMLAERDEVPMGSYSQEPGKDPAQKTLFDNLLRMSSTSQIESATVALTHLMDFQDQDKLPRSWSLAIGKALLEYGLGTISGQTPGLIQKQPDEPVILLMAQMAAFDDPQDWIELLDLPTKRQMPKLGHYLASNASFDREGRKVLAAATRDGVHPDQIVSSYGADADYTWLAAAVNLNAPGMTQALLEAGADPHYKPQAKSSSAADEAKSESLNESAQVLNAWLANNAVNQVLRSAMGTPKKNT